MDKEKETEVCFPNDFPYDVQTKAEEGLQNFWVLSTSPQSTLADMGRSAFGSCSGSLNGVPTPPTALLGAKYDDVVGDLIYRAADQVAKLKLKLHGGDGRLSPVPAMHKHLLGPPRSHAKFHADAGELSRHGFPLTHFSQKINNEEFGMWYGRQGLYQNSVQRAFRETGQASWTIEQNLTHQGEVPVGGFGGGMTAKRSRAGTGVFLPRIYRSNNDGNAYTPVCQQKTGPNTYFPNRSAALLHPHGKNFNAINHGFSQSQLRPEHRNFIPDYDSIMALRNAILSQKQRQLLSTAGDDQLFMMRCDDYRP